MTDDEILSKLTDSLARAQDELAQVATRSEDSLRDELMTRARNTNEHARVLAAIEDMNHATLLQHVNDARRNAIAEIEIKLAQTRSRLGITANQQEKAS